MIFAPLKNIFSAHPIPRMEWRNTKQKAYLITGTRYAEQYSESLWHFGNLSIMPCARRTGRNIRHAAQGLDHGFATLSFDSMASIGLSRFKVQLCGLYVRRNILSRFIYISNA
jgi:hypothetical protein